MDSSETQYLFKETRLNLEPPSSSLIVNVRLPGSNSNRGQRNKQAPDATVEDVPSFRSKHIAVASSVFHRKWHDSPRSFLWRVLEDGSVLSIRVMDIYMKDKGSDLPLVLNFHFTTPIQPNCIAFADPQEHDALCIFVIDQSYHLWTFTLRPDLFRKRSAVDAGLSEVAKRHVPTGLSFKHPHRMVALTTDTLLVTVNDGGMMRFDRTSPTDCKCHNWSPDSPIITLAWFLTR
jgi:nuclear pore complex protein Nup160